MPIELTPIAAWLNSVFADFDYGVTLLIHKLYEWGGDFMTTIMKLISLLGWKGAFLIALSLILVYFKKTRRYGTAMCIALALAAIFVNLYLKVVIERPRPYNNEEYAILWNLVGANKESDYCFPSGHTNAAFAAMVPVFILGKKRWSWLALVFGVLMAVSRVYLVVHYPTDVIGGMITGTIAGMIGVLISLYLPKRWYRWSLPKKKAEEEECLDSAS